MAGEQYVGDVAIESSSDAGKSFSDNSNGNFGGLNIVQAKEMPAWVYAVIAVAVIASIAALYFSMMRG